MRITSGIREHESLFRRRATLLLCICLSAMLGCQTNRSTVKSVEDSGEAVAVERASAGRRALWFFPDRIIDALDMVTFETGIVGLGADVHVTQWATLGAHMEAAFGSVWWNYNRNLGFGPRYAMILRFGPWHSYNMKMFGVGLGWDKGWPGAGAIRLRKRGVFSVDDKIVQYGWVDPWAIGARFFGWGTVDLHPIEVADFITGLLTIGFIDISQDDYANLQRARYKVGMPVHFVPEDSTKDTVAALPLSSGLQDRGSTEERRLEVSRSSANALRSVPTAVGAGLSASNSVAQGSWDHYVVDVTSDTLRLCVEMTGSGSADLYVRYGEQPTLSDWDFRPFLSGSAESVQVDMTTSPPLKNGKWFVGVYGQMASDYRLNVRSDEP